MNVAIHTTNTNNPNMRMYFKTDPRRWADFRRLNLYFHINSVFLDDETTFVRVDNGGLVIEMDSTHALHFKQKTRFRPPYVPTWVTESALDLPRRQPSQVTIQPEYMEQRSLFPDVVENQLIRINLPPLDNLYPLVAVYEVDEIDGSIVQLLIQDCITAYEEEIPLDYPPISLEPEAEERKGKVRISKKA